MALIVRLLRHRSARLAVAVVLVGVLVLLRGVGTDAEKDAPDPIVDAEAYDHAGAFLVATTEDSAAGAAHVVVPDGPGPLSTDIVETDLVIRSRETFYDAMRRLEAGHRDIMALVSACEPYRDLSKVNGGLAFRVALDGDHGVHRLRFDLDDDESYLVFDREDDGGYAVHMLTYPVERRTCVVSGEVNVSLYQSLSDVGAPTALAAKLNDIIGWDVDFRRDVRPGDTYRILYEEVWRDGRFVRTGPVLSLEYVNRGRSHRGHRYVDAEGRPGYYDDAGRNLEKQLMRAPVEYSRISSQFSPRRLHPVLKRWMPHWGVDYAAPVGTPVRAAGSGTVVAARFDKNNGRFVHIRHTNRSYETYYLHFSRFAKGVRKGANVRQGQIIGYVGATGLASGPHLDYRVKVDGRWQDPRKLKLPPAEPLKDGQLADFRAQLALAAYGLAAAPDVCEPTIVAYGRPLGPPWREAGPVVLSDTTTIAALGLKAPPLH